MSEVKRYGFSYGDTFDERNDGAYVTYKDYAALQQKRDAVLAENARMLSDYREIPEMRRIGAPLTPATDTILNQVRAEGVDLFISELSELFKTLKTGGKPWQAIKGVAMRGADFAAQLRAGSAEGGV